MPSHVSITDPYIHEPKGVSSAGAGRVYVSDGLGSGSWEVALTPGTLAVEKVLDAESTAASQLPSGTDTPLLVEFGPAQFGPSDPVQIDGTGVITVNEAGLYYVRAEFSFGRSGGASTAILHFRSLLNDVQDHHTVSVQLSSATAVHTNVDTNWYNLEAGDTLKFQVMRDSAGNNDGGLYKTDPTLAGWLDSPSARVVITRFTTSGS